MKKSTKLILVVFYWMISSNSVAMYIDNAITNNNAKKETRSLVDQARGRNAWARKCGYIKSDFEKALNEMYHFIIFTEERSLFPANPPPVIELPHDPNIPTGENEPCINGLIKWGAISL